jgi:hypothetical protein
MSGLAWKVKLFPSMDAPEASIIRLSRLEAVMLSQM